MHSEVTFQVRHLLTKVRGRFTDFAGTVSFDQEHPERSSASLTIDAASIDTVCLIATRTCGPTISSLVGDAPNAHVHELAGRQDRRRHCTT